MYARQEETARVREQRKIVFGNQFRFNLRVVVALRPDTLVHDDNRFICTQVTFIEAILSVEINRFDYPFPLGRVFRYGSSSVVGLSVAGSQVLSVRNGIE